MRPAGLRAFEARAENRSGIYSYEQRRDRIEEPYGSLLKKNAGAWAFFQTQPRSYRKAAGMVGGQREKGRDPAQAAPQAHRGFVAGAPHPAVHAGGASGAAAANRAPQERNGLT
jgi:hypothetical protein